MPSALDEFRTTVEGALDGRSKAGTASAAGLPRDAISSVLSGHEPRLSRVAEVCNALGLEFYVGPPRAWADADGTTAFPPSSLRDLERSTQGLVRLTVDCGADPIPDDLWPVLAMRRGAAPPLPDNENMPLGARPVDVAELTAAAGGGAKAASEEVAGCVWFRRDWLESRGLDPRQCAVIGVRGESMEPTLPNGSSILVDRSRTAWRLERIYVVRTDDELVVRRAGEAEDGRRLLVSDHRSWGVMTWPVGAALVGEVRWVARTLK